MNRRKFVAGVSLAAMTGCAPAMASQPPMTRQQAFAALCEAIDRETESRDGTGWDAYVIRKRGKPAKLCLSYHNAGPDRKRIDEDLIV